MTTFSRTRRVVTGKDAAGKAVVMIDGTARVHERTETGVGMSLLWLTDATPAGLSYRDDAAARKAGIAPPANGTIFRVVEFAPEKDITADHGTRLQAIQELGVTPEGPRYSGMHPGMHRTATVDYAVVISGEIDMLLDDSEVHLKAGDVVVQQATNHAWVNRADQPCKVAFILIEAKA